MDTPQHVIRHEPRPGEQPTGSVPWREVVVFLAVAMGLCSLISLVFWLGDLDSLFGLSAGLLAMFTPAAAAFVVICCASRPRSTLRATSLRPSGRTATYCLVALILPALVGAATALLAAVLGVLDLDLENFSMLRQRMSQALGGFAGTEGSGFPPVLPFLGWLLVQLTSVVSGLVFAFGEEYGWRGYLLPKLIPVGIWPMLLLSGLIWAVWHAPLLLLGDYAGPGDFAVFFVLFLLGRVLPQVVIVSWLRLVSGSVWAAVVLHASSTSLFTAVAILSESGSALNPALAVAGHEIRINWFVMAAVAVLLAVTGQLRVRPDDPALPQAPSR